MKLKVLFKPCWTPCSETSCPSRCGRTRLIFECGQCCESNGSVDVIRAETGKSPEHFVDGIPFRKTCQDGAQQNSRASENGLAAAYLRVTDEQSLQVHSLIMGYSTYRSQKIPN